MKSLLFILIFGILIYSCSSSKVGNAQMRYFDENNVEISKSKFDQIRSTNKFLDVTGDSINHKKLNSRGERGRINNKKALEVLLEKTTGRELDSTKPIVIIYHPGKDPCNSGGTTDKEWIKAWYGQLEEGLYKLAKVKPIYIYKNSDGLKKYEGILNWIKDPDGTIERLFFEYHYPCKSFTVISKEGDYISYYGEFSKKYVWAATQIIIE